MTGEVDYLITFLVIAQLALTVGYFKSLADRAFCMEHNLTIGQMFHSGHLDSKQTTNLIFSAIVDNKF